MIRGPELTPAWHFWNKDNRDLRRWSWLSVPNARRKFLKGRAFVFSAVRASQKARYPRQLRRKVLSHPKSQNEECRVRAAGLSADSARALLTWMANSANNVAHRWPRLLRRGPSPPN